MFEHICSRKRNDFSTVFPEVRRSMPNLLEKRREYMCDLRKAKNEKYILLTISFRTQARQKH